MSFVKNGEQGAERVPGNAGGEEQVLKQGAARNMHGEFVGGEPEVAHHVNTCRNQFRVRSDLGAAEDVHVELEEFPEPAPLHLFIPEEARDGIPSDGAFERIAPCRNHARERGRELGPKRHSPFGLVFEHIELFFYFVPGFLSVELEGLEHGAVIVLESIALAGAAPGGKESLGQRHILRIKIASSLRACGCLHGSIPPYLHRYFSETKIDRTAGYFLEIQSLVSVFSATFSISAQSASSM